MISLCLIFLWAHSLLVLCLLIFSSYYYSSTPKVADRADETVTPKMDLAQFVAILMIPQFLEPPSPLPVEDNYEKSDREQAKEAPLPTTAGLDMASVWQRLFTLDGKDSLNYESFDESSDDGNTDTENANILTMKKLKGILDKHEITNVDKSFVKEMLRAVPKPASFSKALVKDLKAFNIDWKNHATTNYDDIMQVESKTIQQEEESKGSALERKFNASFIDYMADNYRRPRYVMLLWAAGVFSYVAYVFGIADDNSWAKISCGDSTGCSVAQGLVSWLAVLLHLSTLGLAFIFLSSFGNSIFASRDARSLVSILFAIGIVVVAAVLPYWIVST